MVSRHQVRYPYYLSHAGGARAFSKVLKYVDSDSKRKICAAVDETKGELFHELEQAVREKDVRKIDGLTEEVKWAETSGELCRLS